MSDKLFLLGGQDLEMLEIKKLLERENIAYKDKNLKWGAKLSDYQNELSFNGALLISDYKPALAELFMA